MKNFKRLEFEEELLAQIGKPTNLLRKKTTSLLWMGVLINVVLWLSVFILAAAPLSFGLSGSQGALKETLLGFVQGLQQGNPNLALQMSSETSDVGEGGIISGKKTLFQGNRGSSVASGSEDVSVGEDSLRYALNQLYADLTQQGVNWEKIVPVAFVGVSARAKRAESMQRSMRVVTGELFVTCDRKGYVIELSARHLHGKYYVSHIWSWYPWEQSIDDFKSYAKLKWAELQNESDAESMGVRLSWFRKVLIIF